MKLGRHAFLVALLLVPLGALAQPWPSKPPNALGKSPGCHFV